MNRRNAKTSVIGKAALGPLGIGLVLLISGGCSGGNPQATAGTTASSASASSSATGGASSTTLFAPPSSVGEQVSGTAGAVPEEFPDAVPLPTQDPVVAFSNTSGEAKSFDLTYTGTDLNALVGDIKQRLAGAQFKLLGEYNSKVKGVPSAGFVARSDAWVVTVGGTFTNGTASVHVSVISA